MSQNVQNKICSERRQTSNEIQSLHAHCTCISSLKHIGLCDINYHKRGIGSKMIVEARLMLLLPTFRVVTIKTHI